MCCFPALFLFLLFLCCSLRLARSDYFPIDTYHYQQHQQQSLLAFKSLVSSDPFHSLANWTANIYFCNWAGVTCDLPQQLVLSLNLKDMGLQGSVSKHLANMSFLQTIDLSGNALHGSIPPQLGSISQLKYLSLRGNHLGGAIPSSLGNLSALISLDLGHNYLAGKIPSQMGNLTELTFLDLSVNYFNGTIPSFRSLENLERLFLHKNKIVGTIPDDFGRLKSLRLLKISHNKLSGRIPQSIGNLQRLKRLFLHHNHLSDMIPGSLGYCNNLQLLDLSHNSLIGSIPQEVASLPNIKIYLNLSFNYLVGSAPEEIGKLVRAQAVDFSHNLLNGVIPNTLGNCTALKYLNLSRNSMQGSIPDSLGNLRNMRYVDLSSNSLSGTIPASVKKLKLLHSLNLSFNSLTGDIDKGGAFANATAVISLDGNVGLCGSIVSSRLPTCGRQKTHSATLRKVLGAVGAVFLLLGFVWMGIFYRQGLFSWVGKKSYEYPSWCERNKISYEEVVAATGGINEAYLLGSSDFASVYKGILSDGRDGAFKVFNHDAYESFEAECKILKKVRHRNIAKIISSCSSVNFKVLVFKFYSQGSLDNHLYPDESDQVCHLGLKERLEIVVNVANAIEYLHHDCHVQVIHCDIKPSNVLLDEDLTAYLTDFGIARLMGEVSPDSSNLKGSVGYIPPEYGLSSRVSTRGDVYSYGVLLLEMLTAKRPTDDMFEADLTLHRWVNMAFLNDVLDVVDERLRPNIDGSGRQLVVALFRIGLWCTKDSPAARPTMTQVSSLLKKSRDYYRLGSSIDLTSSMPSTARPTMV